MVYNHLFGNSVDEEGDASYRIGVAHSNAGGDPLGGMRQQHQQQLPQQQNAASMGLGNPSAGGPGLWGRAGMQGSLGMQGSMQPQQQSASMQMQLAAAGMQGMPNNSAVGMQGMMNNSMFQQGLPRQMQQQQPSQQAGFMQRMNAAQTGNFSQQQQQGFLGNNDGSGLGSHDLLSAMAAANPGGGTGAGGFDMYGGAGGGQRRPSLGGGMGGGGSSMQQMMQAATASSAGPQHFGGGVNPAGPSWMNQQNMYAGGDGGAAHQAHPAQPWHNKNPALTSLATAAHMGGMDPSSSSFPPSMDPYLMQQQQQHMQQQHGGFQQGLVTSSGGGGMFGDDTGPRRRSSSVSSNEDSYRRGAGDLGHTALFAQQQQHHSKQDYRMLLQNLPTDADTYGKRKEKKKRAKTFPEKLMDAMVDHAADDAVAWLPDGKSFVIVSPDLFVKDVLNQVFKEAKYASFIRKLHRWGFVRLTSGTGTDCFHHPLFQRNRKDMASKITCSTRDKDGNLKSPRNEKPPSLAGVEKFIRAKAAALAAAAAAKRSASSMDNALGSSSMHGPVNAGGVLDDQPLDASASVGDNAANDDVDDDEHDPAEDDGHQESKLSEPTGVSMSLLEAAGARQSV